MDYYKDGRDRDNMETGHARPGITRFHDDKQNKNKKEKDESALKTR
ncbi:MAG: hypothetical protein PUH29_08210 [Lachnospiraceae bacterium]|nr:hypothetical protein [Lachnospiraceae bacterium]MDY5496996.1 hypothetical protein [Anaerobutyricum sp.]